MGFFFLKFATFFIIFLVWGVNEANNWFNKFISNILITIQ
jgi:hypothetical protein